MKVNTDLTLSRRIRFRLAEFRRGRVKGCVDHVCRGGQHQACVDCGGLCCSRALRVEPRTLRRRFVPACSRCAIGESSRQRGLREARAERDWNRGLPDQFPGITRATVRRFVESDREDQLVGQLCVDVEGGAPAATTLNASLSTLGMAERVYAEIRGNEVWLRKVA